MIAYHGTNKLAAKSILRVGFRKGTYFAFNKTESMNYGNFIFSVIFKPDPNLWHGEADGWQFHLRHKLNRNKIVGVEKITTDRNVI